MITSIAVLIAAISVATTMTMAQATPSPIVLISGNGPLGTPDPTITMLVGPANGPFGAAFVPADFAAAIGGPSAQIVSILDPFWNPNPGANGAQWIANNIDGRIGTTGLYAKPFTVDCTEGIAAASLLFDYSVDDHLGSANNEGLFVNGNPVTGSKDQAPSNWLVSKQSGPFDITSDVQQGSNHLFVYQVDTGGPGGVQYTATIVYECNLLEEVILEEVRRIEAKLDGDRPSLITQIVDALTSIQADIAAILGFLQDPNFGDSTERVSVTVNLDDIKLKTGEVMVLLDTTDSGTLSTVHVAANLPCNIMGDGKPTSGALNDDPGIWVVAGVAGPNLSGVINDSDEDTGFVGPDNTCVFHGTISAAEVTGGVITDVIIIHPDDHPPVDDKKDEPKKHEKLKGVVVTITGTYN